ncbi:uncharacterized protein sS8_4236 [Methylocaldum marinum]|jgi:hypothetical protein|uniref:Uncharacterized protein n=1 Tax=Methylocaldum marinum TaxID=1432792 RepID=A0A250KXB8_9GAMM|nr:hypothetical protein [Methylocaldum marinum]BBA36166.1 uncharacterized protein sS8_4236 [Methylocaldum marinum]
MSLFLQLFTLGLVGMLFTCILYVLFGQLTVRKLRKNPNMKGRLGVEFVSGFDILNVASALSAPQWLRDRISRSTLSYLAPDYQALYENTTLFDRIFARVFWGISTVSTSFMLLLVILDKIGVFD